ncbi:MAG TPA: hypothetical protein VML75_00725 [Kofleriaceae bacterium]|nr:hypothetical protein [Kofleriaceae bacterium]
MPDQHREVAERVRALCEGGLQKYRAGDIEGAMIDWDSARSMDSSDPTAQSYIQRVAMGLEPEEPSAFDGDDDDLYDEVEVEVATPHQGIGGGPAQRAFLDAARDLFAMDDLDAGWTLEPEAAELPPPPTQARAPSRGVPGLDEPSDMPDEIMGLPEGSVQRETQAGPDVDDLPGLELECEDGRATLDAREPLLELEPLGQRRAQPEGGSLRDDLRGDTVDLEPHEVEEYREASTRELPPPFDLSDMGDSLELPEPPAGPRGETDAEITVPGGAADEVSEPAPMALSDEAMEALRPPEQGTATPEDTTVERPGMVARGFALPDLDELDDGGARTDDRHETTAEVRIQFREATDSGLDDELTSERRAVFGEGTYDEEMTVERGGPKRLGAREGTYDEEMTVERHSGEAPVKPSVIVDLQNGEAHSNSWSDLCNLLSRQVDDTLPSSAGDDDRVRLRVGAFIDRARLELDRGKTEVAVTALELALGEQPDSAVAQKLIHRHKDLLTEIYQMYLGNMGSIPTLAVPMHELSAKRLDSRAVFLLSRIDGTFTFEEILDMSGMSSLEAYRHLAKLLLEGILEVR